MKGVPKLAPSIKETRAAYADASAAMGKGRRPRDANRPATSHRRLQGIAGKGATTVRQGFRQDRYNYSRHQARYSQETGAKVKQSDKRLIRKARRKARRAKVKTEIDRWRETVYAQLLDLDKRVRSIEETLAELVKANELVPGVLPLRPRTPCRRRYRA